MDMTGASTVEAEVDGGVAELELLEVAVELKVSVIVVEPELLMTVAVLELLEDAARFMSSDVELVGADTSVDDDADEEDMAVGTAASGD